MKSALVLGLFLAVHANASSWDGANDPSLFESNYQYRYNALPNRAMLPLTPWSETYWPSNKGSINIRWNSEEKYGFDYSSPSKEEVMKMSQADLAKLSPAEKYDLAMGHYDYPLKNEVAASADPHAKDWAGICNGWSPAAIQFREPKAVVVKNPDGINIPFGSSDVKGLLSYWMAFHSELDTVQVGTKCQSKFGQITGSRACTDVNPGAMHVLLTNELGLRGKAISVERDPGPEIWNQPVYGYEFHETASALTRRVGDYGVQVHMTMYYTDELEESKWNPVVGTPDFKGTALEMDYTLDIDSSGNITGGDWISGVHPDFFWKARNQPQFSGDFAGLSKIYVPN